MGHRTQTLVDELGYSFRQLDHFAAVTRSVEATCAGPGGVRSWSDEQVMGLFLLKEMFEARIDSDPEMANRTTEFIARFIADLRWEPRARFAAWHDLGDIHWFCSEVNVANLAVIHSKGNELWKSSVLSVAYLDDARALVSQMKAAA